MQFKDIKAGSIISISSDSFSRRGRITVTYKASYSAIRVDDLEWSRGAWRTLRVGSPIRTGLDDGVTAVSYSDFSMTFTLRQWDALVRYLEIMFCDSNIDEEEGSETVTRADSDGGTDSPVADLTSLPVGKPVMLVRFDSLPVGARFRAEHGYTWFTKDGPCSAKSDDERTDFYCIDGALPVAIEAPAIDTRPGLTVGLVIDAIKENMDRDIAAIEEEAELEAQTKHFTSFEKRYAWTIACWDACMSQINNIRLDARTRITEILNRSFE